MGTNTAIVIAYAAYLGIAIPLVVWLARTLSKNGELFLTDVFVERPELAPAVNKLLVTGFYMANLGLVGMLLKNRHPGSAIEVIEALASRLGGLLLLLAGVHFFNLYVFSAVRRRATIKHLPPPVRPTYSAQQTAAWGAPQ
jgi:hypothetical protein